MNLSKIQIQTLLHDIVFQYQYHQVVRYIVSFIVSVIMVRSALPQVELGRYELLLFIIASISGFWSSGIKNAYISFYHHQDENSKKHLPITTLVLLSGVAAIIGMVLLFIPGVLTFFHAESLFAYRGMIAIYLFFFASIPLIETLFLLNKESKKLFQYTHWSQGGILILTLLTAFFRPDLQSFIFILILWACIRWLYLLFLLFKPGEFSISKQQIYVFAVFSLPLIFNMMLGSAMDMIDGLFVAHFFETDFFPIFRYGAREMPLAALLFGSLSLAMIPMLSENMANLSILKAKATKHLHILAPLSLILMIISPYAFVWFYGDIYRESAYIFNIYLLIIISRVLMPQTVCFAKHQHAIIIWSGILEIIVNIVLSYWWMMYFGVYGLAAGTIVAFAVHKLILIGYNYKVNGIRFKEYIELKPYLIYTFLLIATFFITSMIEIL